MSKLWGGRFSKQTDKLVDMFSKSIQYDYKLAEYDCLGSLVHIDILKSAGLLTVKEHTKLKKGLGKILKSVKDGKFKPDLRFEDIHSYIQHLLEKDKTVGKAALKLHTCRSRNDQVAFDVRCYCLDNIIATYKKLLGLNDSLYSLAKKNKDIFIPGYTHLQHAIPVSMYNHLFAYRLMFYRDAKRLMQIFTNTELTLGAGALAGTMIDAALYEKKAKGLLPKAIQAPKNSIDTVSDRDFVIEALSALALMQMHLSRMAEDLILWASKEFDFIDIDDAFCTGSSLMPQKKNPDVLELIRGYTGRLYGNLINTMVMMKGLPLSYNRDMQLDKEPLFDSFEVMQAELEVLAKLCRNIKFNKTNILKQLDDESLFATDLADFLVKKGVAFKDAHAIIGKLIQFKFKNKEERLLKDLSDASLKSFHPSLNKTVIKKIINPRASVQSKKSVKGTKKI